MKRKLVTLLTAVCITGLLFTGCGKEAEIEKGEASTTVSLEADQKVKPIKGKATPKSMIDNSSPVIGYIFDDIDKNEKPNVVVFQEGNAFCYYDTDYTLGDFSNMTDEEVLKSLKEELSAKNDEKIKELQAEIDSCQSEIEEVKAANYCWYEYMDLIVPNFTGETQEYYDHLMRLFGAGYVDCETITMEESCKELLEVMAFYGEKVSNEEPFLEAARAYDALIEEHRDEMLALKEDERNSSIANIQEEIDSRNETIAKLQAEANGENGYKIAINMMTDETGNNVQVEYIMLLGEDKVARKLPVYAHILDYCEYPITIYDSNYYGYVLSDGKSNSFEYLFFRDSSGKGLELSFDDLDTKGIFVDAKDEELLTK